MRVLLTGATGFFGRAVHRELIRMGYDVRCVIRTGTSTRLARSDKTSEIVETNDLFVNDRAWWAEVCKGIDVAIHSAWYTEPGKYLASDLNATCLNGTIALAEGALAAQVHQFVGIGTCLEYDLDFGHLSIDTPLAPTTPYAAAKVSAYLLLTDLFRETGTSFLWARLFYLFGAGERSGRLVSYLHTQLSAGRIAELSSGKQIRDYLDVDVAARLLLSDIQSGVRGASNICSGEARTVADIAIAVADEYGRRDLLAFGARADNLVDPPMLIGVRPSR